MVTVRLEQHPLLRTVAETVRGWKHRSPKNALDSLDICLLRALLRATHNGTRGTDAYGLVLELGGFPYLFNHGIGVKDVMRRTERLKRMGLATGSLKNSEFYPNNDSIILYPSIRD